MKRIVLFLCVALLIPNILLLGQPRAPFGEGREKKVARLLKLNDEQQKKFEEVSSQFQKKMVDLKSTIEKNRIDLKKMIFTQSIDEKLLIQLTDENSKLQGEMKSLAVKRWIEVNKMLDKDQQKVWAKVLGKVGMMQERMKGMMMKNRMMRKGDNDKGEW